MGTLISKIVFQPPNDNGYEGFQKINTADGAHVCFLRTTPPKVYLEPRKSSVVYFHGNGENLILLRSLLQSVAKITGKEVFAMDYRGYNQKKATRTLPNEIQFKSDVEAFVDGLQLKGDDVIVWEIAGEQRRHTRALPSCRGKRRHLDAHPPERLLLRRNHKVSLPSQSGGYIQELHRHGRH